MHFSNEFTISEILTPEQLDQLHLLYQKAWWSLGRKKEEIVTLLKNSIAFASIENTSQKLVGFARVLTDELRYAAIFDVMVQEDLRGTGLGKAIIQSILSHSRLARVKYFELTCAPEMIDFYKKWGFSDDFENVVAMRRKSF